MLTKEFVITCPTGLHARPAALLANAAGAFSSDIFLRRNGRDISARSIMSIMTLGLKAGDGVTLVISGADEVIAMARMDSFFNQEMAQL